jgi:hypothetical protein
MEAGCFLKGLGAALFVTFPELFTRTDRELDNASLA